MYDAPAARVNAARPHRPARAPPQPGIRSTPVTAAAREVGVEVRAGVHTGEVERRGDNVGGLAVHIGARVAGLAQGGEVLVSQTVNGLVAGSGLCFEDRGRHRLRGVPGEWQLSAAREGRTG